ncbi:putative membrane protein CtaG family, copper [Bacillus freudenreichii]|nr:putative membrane protein CtaG family, copper [Bacillus freudenreichii]
MAGIATSKQPRLKKWPKYRYVLWVAGIASITVTLIGPLFEQAHTDFIFHMTGHLLLGMLAPLLLVLSAPVTLLLRSLDKESARRVAQIFKSQTVQFISHPIVASILNIGGLWVLYTTGLFSVMHDYFAIHALVHIHIFLAGYIFTAAMIYVDPVSHRFSYLFRTIVFILALAGHQILAKYIYAHPPDHVSFHAAQAGGMLMYYGGDAIDLVIIIIFFRQWYKSARPHSPIAVSKTID